VKVIVNGEPRELPEGTTVAAVVESISPAATGIAVAVNDEVVGRAAWTGTTVRDGDRVEVLTAVQGG